MLTNAFDTKFDTVIVCNAAKNGSYRDDDVTNYVNFFEKVWEKWLKYGFFSKINLVADIKKISKIFFQLLKVKIAC